jgi:hypothetical protein
LTVRKRPTSAVSPTQAHDQSHADRDLTIGLELGKESGVWEDGVLEEVLVPTDWISRRELGDARRLKAEKAG